MYKKTVLSLSFIFLFLQAVLVSAQQPVQSNPTQNNGSIIEELNTARSGQGNVTIYQDEALKDILAKPAPANLPVFSTGDGSVQYVKMRGYKIQVFSGNDQRKSKDEAYYKQKLINNSFEDIETVVYFN